MPKSKKPHVIPLSVPHMSGNEVKYLTECIETSWVSYVGPFVSRLEEKMANYIGTPFAVATNSGTAALHTALMVAGIQAGEEVLVPDLAFIAPVNAVHYCGAIPVFMDVEPTYGQMDPDKVAEFLDTKCLIRQGKTFNKSTGRHVKAIIPVHLLGHPCDMDRILAMARKYHLLVIEDCAQSLGAEYKGKRVGSFGDLGCFSYNGNKIITSGGGGMITTRNKKWADRAKYLTTQARDSMQEYIHHSVGYNYRLTNIQAAVGLAQMENLDDCVAYKREIRHRYDHALRNVPGIRLPAEAPWAFSTFWLYTIVVDQKLYGASCRELQAALEKENIQARTLWAPLHEQHPYQKNQSYKISASKELFKAALSLPSSIGLTVQDQSKVIGIIQSLAT